MQCGHPPLELYEKWHPRDYTDVIVRLDPFAVKACACGVVLSTTFNGQHVEPTHLAQAAVEAASQVRDISHLSLQRASDLQLHLFEPQFRYPTGLIKAVKIPVRKRPREEVHREHEIVERNQGSLAVLKYSLRPRYFGTLDDSEVE